MLVLVSYLDFDVRKRYRIWYLTRCRTTTYNV